MSDVTPAAPDRHPHWKWWVCGLLLLATTINYMDRMTINQMAPAIMADLDMDKEDYGDVEAGFSLAFAFGALLAGWLADRWNVYWLYPTAVIAWSAMGLATGFVTGFFGLLACRFFLGLFEAGNWPSALRTTQRILPPEQRTMGNGILQSGAAIGAILTPFVVLFFLDKKDPGWWRYPFIVVGVVGMFWSLLWWKIVRPEDLALPPAPPLAEDEPRPSWWDRFRTSVLPLWKDRRFWILVFVVIMINTSWHIFRVWLPLYLEEEHGYDMKQLQYFGTAYYLATDLGSLAAGFGTLWLMRRGLAVHGSRMGVFLCGALLTAVSVVAAWMGDGLLLVVLLLIVGFGALSVFPCYYSFTQELTTKHQGKVTGMLGFSCWMAMAVIHKLVGKYLEDNKSYASESYAVVFTVAGLAPLAGWLALVLFWKKPVAKSEAGTTEA